MPCSGGRGLLSSCASLGIDMAAVENPFLLRKLEYIHGRAVSLTFDRQGTTLSVKSSQPAIDESHLIERFKSISLI